VALSIGVIILDSDTVLKMQQILNHSYYQLLNILQFYSLQAYNFAVSDGKYMLLNFCLRCFMKYFFSRDMSYNLSLGRDI
jgi:hypothetical protein